MSSKTSSVDAPSNGRCAGQHAVENDAQAPDVGAAVEPVALAANLFGRHVRRRAGDLAAPGPPVVIVQRQAEVGDVRPLRASIRILSGFRSRWTKPCSWANEVLRRSAINICGRSLESQPFVAAMATTATAFDILEHDEAADGLVAIDLINRDDAGMFDPGGEPGLVKKPVEVVLGRRNGRPAAP